MDSAIAKQLMDKMYEKRKSAALDLEKQIRECYNQGDHRKIGQIIDQLVEMFTNVSNPLHVRNGGLIGLAGTAISLQMDIAPYMEKFVDPILACFSDPENKIRYFSAECLYNIAKVSKGEILVYFNSIFDALSKLAADSEMSVKNGAELLDRLLKDIVSETASTYIPQYAETEKVRDHGNMGILVPHPDDIASGEDYNKARRAFSLARFIPLLSDRIYVISPFTRSFLVSWITVLDSVPELELVTYLPEFLEGLLKYLSDPIEDVRTATETILADFLREIRQITKVRKEAEDAKAKQDAASTHQEPTTETETKDKVEDPQGEFLPDGAKSVPASYKDDPDSIYSRDVGAWVPGQGVHIDYAAIIEILLSYLDGQSDEIQQLTSLRWLSDFLSFAPEVMVPFTPRLIGAVLPNLAHHVMMIQSSATRTNQQLLKVIQSLPSPDEVAPKSAVPSEKPAISKGAVSPVPSTIPSPVPPRLGTAKENVNVSAAPLNRDMSVESLPESGTKSRSNTLVPETSAGASRTLVSLDIASTAPITINDPLRSHSPTSMLSGGAPATAVSQSQQPVHPEDNEPFDYSVTVNALTIQFLSEHEETRVAALKWLIMLHQKAPKRILAMDDGTFPALLKTLSDSSEEVIKQDLQLIAQISSSSDESYFKAFMVNLLELFSTDRRLLDTRGSLIIRQLCLNLNTEKIYRAFAEIIEKEEDLEFASVMVQKLNIILITSTELADFRRRLKTIETRQDGQALFTTLYRCWSHNAVAIFSLCLLAQAYEHASNLLTIFADLEITVPMLVQVDKLVQLIESPVFTYLRLQLLEPERYPYLFKCLYGLLMLLPQSTAFVSLRNRLNAVNSAGFLHIAPKSSTSMAAARSKIGREDIRWQELLAHFRTVQLKHDKARRQALGPSGSVEMDLSEELASNPPSEDRAMSPPNGSRASSRAGVVRNGTPTPASSPQRNGVLSPLNPRARATNIFAGVTGRVTGGNSSASSGSSASPRPSSPPIDGAKVKRTPLGLRKV